MRLPFACIGLLFVIGCSQTSVTNKTNGETKGYDSALAKRLGADAYGMKKYVMAFLKAGPHRDQDSTTAAQLQRAHLENIGKIRGRRTARSRPFSRRPGNKRNLYF